MDAKLFRWWLRQLGELSVRQVEQLKGRLAGSEARNDARDWINRRAEESLACSYCRRLMAAIPGFSATAVVTVIVPSTR